MSRRVPAQIRAAFDAELSALHTCAMGQVRDEPDGTVAPTGAAR